MYVLDGCSFVIGSIRSQDIYMSVFCYPKPQICTQR